MSGIQGPHLSRLLPLLITKEVRGTGDLQTAQQPAAIPPQNTGNLLSVLFAQPRGEGLLRVKCDSRAYSSWVSS